jgi:hypothetical protein
MSILTDFFVASEPELKTAFRFSESGDFDITPFPNCQFKNVDVVKLATLQILCGTSYEEAIDRLAQPVHPTRETQGVHCLPGIFVNGLANQNNVSMSDAARKWAATEELQADEFSQDDAEEVLQELSRLARVAQGERKNLYHWWCV